METTALERSLEELRLIDSTAPRILNSNSDAQRTEGDLEAETFGEEMDVLASVQETEEEGVAEATSRAPSEPEGHATNSALLGDGAQQVEGEESAETVPKETDVLASAQETRDEGATESEAAPNGPVETEGLANNRASLVEDAEASNASKDVNNDATAEEGADAGSRERPWTETCRHLQSKHVSEKKCKLRVEKAGSSLPALMCLKCGELLVDGPSALKHGRSSRHFLLVRTKDGAVCCAECCETEREAVTGIPAVAEDMGGVLALLRKKSGFELAPAQIPASKGIKKVLAISEEEEAPLPPKKPLGPKALKRLQQASLEEEEVSPRKLSGAGKKSKSKRGAESEVDEVALVSGASKPRGIRNIGCSCYVSSMLQMFNRSDALRRGLERSSGYGETSSALGEILSEVRNAEGGGATTRYGPVDPSRFFHAGWHPFKLGQQQDAHEAVLSLFQALEEEANPQKRLAPLPVKTKKKSGSKAKATPSKKKSIDGKLKKKKTTTKTEETSESAEAATETAEAAPEATETPEDPTEKEPESEEPVLEDPSRPRETSPLEPSCVKNAEFYFASPAVELRADPDEDEEPNPAVAENNKPTETDEEDSDSSSSEEEEEEREDLEEEEAPRAASTHERRDYARDVYLTEIVHDTECAECGTITKRVEPSPTIEAELVRGGSSSSCKLTATLRTGFFASSTLSVAEGSGYRCETCCRRAGVDVNASVNPLMTDATKRARIGKSSSNLLVLIKLFAFQPSTGKKAGKAKGGWGGDWTQVKLDTAVELDASIDLNEFRARDTYVGAHDWYDLAALVEHRGSSLSKGHYVAYSRDPAGNWYYASDETVRAVSASKVSESQPYIALYVRRQAIEE